MDRHIARLRKGLRGRAEVRATSARWAWVEYVLAQGGLPEGRAVHVAVRNGGRFADYRRAFAERDEVTTRKTLFIVRDTPDDSARRTERWLTPT